MEFEAWGGSDPGARDKNEDACLVDAKAGLFVVGDGIGGGVPGEIASTLLIEILRTRLRDARARLLKDTNSPDPNAVRAQLMEKLPKAINEVSEIVYLKAGYEPNCKGLSTTVVALQLVGGNGVVAHVGDSRLYMVRGGQIYQVTEDHTLGVQLTRRGVMTAEQLAAFPHRNALSRSVGVNPTSNVDTVWLDVYPKDRFVLCSDGLSDVVSAETIREVVVGCSPREAVEKLTQMAKDAGGRDNVTVIVVEAKGATLSVETLRTEQKVGLLQDVFLFGGLTFQETLRVLGVVREVRFSHHEVIIREGESDDELYILMKGHVAISRAGVSLAQLKTGEHFGELALISDGVRSATATAVGDTVVLAIRRDDFFNLVNNDHALAVKLLWRFLQNLADQVKNVSTELSVERRNTHRW